MCTDSMALRDDLRNIDPATPVTMRITTGGLGASYRTCTTSADRAFTKLTDYGTRVWTQTIEIGWLLPSGSLTTALVLGLYARQYPDAETWSVGDDFGDLVAAETERLAELAA